jgi:uncharacterized Zn finger protein
MAYWPEYVPVAVRRDKARKEMEKLRKKGKNIQPVELEGRTIAASFWGKGWCKHLESFSDYSNRLPRGRTYVRNGSVCHLAIEAGRIEAYVSGTSLYSVSIAIRKLKPAAWKKIREKCAGQVGSMLELLQGKLSDQVMRIVTDRDEGLFPRPREIKLSCSCPDWAVMCKHVAAVLYGIGSRLDREPELLFLLRGADPEELIASEVSLPGADTRQDDSLDGEQLADIFGIDIETESPGTPMEAAAGRPAEKKRAVAEKQPPKKKTAARKRKTAQQKNPARQRSGKEKNTLPKIRPTGKSVKRLRNKLNMSTSAFADAIGVSSVTIRRWEKTPGRLQLHERCYTALAELHKKAGKK